MDDDFKASKHKCNFKMAKGSYADFPYLWAMRKGSYFLDDVNKGYIFYFLYVMMFQYVFTYYKMQNYEIKRGRSAV